MAWKHISFISIIFVAFTCNLPAPVDAQLPPVTAYFSIYIAPFALHKIWMVNFNITAGLTLDYIVNSTASNTTHYLKWQKRTVAVSNEWDPYPVPRVCWMSYPTQIVENYLDTFPVGCYEQCDVNCDLSDKKLQGDSPLDEPCQYVWRYALYKTNAQNYQPHHEYLTDKIIEFKPGMYAGIVWSHDMRNTHT